MLKWFSWQYDYFINLQPFSAMIFGRIKAVLVFILNILRRSLCCFRRRRKLSVDSVPLTDVGVVPNYQPQQGNEDLSNWNRWEDGEGPPQTVEDHIKLYRSKPKQPEALPQPDYFQDMEPDIKKQTKVILKPRDMNSSRLAFTADAIVPSGESELESWEENESRQNQWAEAEAWDADEILREKRKEEQKKKLMEREHRRTLVSKLS